MSEIKLPGDNRAVDGSGYWLRPWHALLDLLARRLGAAETNIETHSSQIASINAALAENDIVATPVVPDEETVETPVPEEEPVVTDWVTVMKPVSEDKSNTTTYGDDPHLYFAMEADTVYAFRIVVFWRTLENATIKWRIVGPTPPAMLYYQMTNLSNNGSRNETIKFEFAHTQNRGSDQGQGCIQIDGVTDPGAEGGVLSFQWAPDSNDSDPTSIIRGSYIQYRKVA